MLVLITGAGGFIGSHLVKYIIDNTDWKVVVVDKISYVNNHWFRLKENGTYNTERCRCIEWDLVYPFSDEIVKEIGNVDIIINMASETHVDKSIKEPIRVITNNVMLTVNMLEFARKLKNLKVFHYFSTDEVYGPAPEGTAYSEDAPHKSRNPYSASKSASEQICIAYNNTYKIPLLISNLMNVFGEMQDEEKFIPMVIEKLLKDETVFICTDEKTGVVGSRFYIYAPKVARAILFILNHTLKNKPEEYEKYNIVGDREVNNLELALKIAKHMNKELNYKLVKQITQRPGQDTRYALDGSKLKSIGYENEDTFDDDLNKVVDFTLKSKGGTTREKK